MKLLRQALIEGSYLLGLEARNIQSIFHQTLDHVVERGLLPSERRQEVEEALLAREEQVATAIGQAVAIPHVYLDFFTEPVIVFVRLAKPLNLGAPDGIPTRFLFVLLGPQGRAAEHLDTLTAIARLMSDDEFRYDARIAQSHHELLAALDRFSARTAPSVAVVKAPPEGLMYTGRLFGGILGDIRRRLPHYSSDFRDGLHLKSIGSTLFLFFACLAPAVTFGGIMAELTGNHIGVVEMILASAVCGIVYALFSGQPLIMLGGTGPLLIFTAMLYELCRKMELPFLETLACVGLWASLFLLIMAVTDASCLMRFFTRFTDEIFAALISIIFISSAVTAIGEIFVDVYDEQTTSHDRALVPLILALGTFYVATVLSRFRRSRYLLPKMREFLSDFGPAIALAMMTFIYAFWFNDVELAVLPAPESIQPTIERSWMINPFSLPAWVWLAGLIPAALVAVLVYVDQNITARLINSPDNKLQKGEAYHLDLAIIAVLIGVCSMFGLPWVVAATVRSLNHLRSLATVEDVVSGRGESQERIVHVRETRLTGLAIHMMIGLSLLMLPILRLIPMAVLYGLFLFMGVVSMAGNQFLQRLSFWLMDSSLYPSTHYTRRVPKKTIHMFTLLQVACLALLWLVEEGPLGILFPLFLALLVPIRILASRFFVPEHLAALDAEEIPEEETTRFQ